MALSIERQFAKLVRSYARLKELYEASQNDRKMLRDELSDSRIEIRRLKRELRDAEGMSARITPKVLAQMQYALNHLFVAGDQDAAAKISEWMDELRETGIPVADARELRDLLQEWSETLTEKDPEALAALWMRTRSLLDVSAEVE